MLRNVHHLVVLSCFSASLAYLSGCASTTSQQIATGEAEATQPNLIASDPLVDQQLTAVETLIERRQTEEANLLLNNLIFERLSIEEQTRYAIARADIALLLGEGQEALTWLSGNYVYLFDGLPLEQQIAVSLKRAEAFELSGRPLSAARERIYVAPVLDETAAFFNREQIWFDLQLVPEDQLRELAAVESSPDLNAWLDLALISISESDDLYRLLSSVEQWQLANPRHPAALELPGSLQILRELVVAQPTHIGVLLPLSGPLEKAGNAIRNGLLTSWYQAKQNGHETPELSFYDTTASQDIQNTYKQAVLNGAQTIIGPLSKANVQRLAAAEELPVPVLALNYLDAYNQKIPNLYQFGLSPEDEAVQVANDIWQEGVRNVMVVAPNSQWGTRVSDAFIRDWELKGGTITSKALFERPDQYLGTIKNALNIQHSERRQRLLESTLGEPVEFEFRRRQDVDMVFMVAFPAQARQLKPIINYQRGTDLDVVATSSIYSGLSDPAKDQDLEGIRFVEMPWRLEQSETKNSAAQAFPDSINNYSSLVALGVDAYRLYPRLSQMSVFSDVRIQGVTGNMTMNSQGRMERQLDWALIEDGFVTLNPETDIVE